jgi:lipoate-protein ligase A
VHETYARISSALKRGLEVLGAEGIEFSRSQPDFREHYTGDDSASCFSVSALSELMWHGRKLVGSAQRRYGDVLLQHGSLLMGMAHLDIIDLLYPGADAARRQLLRQRLAERTVTLDEIFGGTSPTFMAVADALSSGFRELFDVELRYVEEHSELFLPNS